MKRVLSLVLALVLVLGMIPTFAADMTGGQHLYEHEFIAGDGMGNLNEADMLTREQLAKLILELNGSKEEAEALTLPPSFTDSAKISAWARPYVAYAQIEGLMVGFSDGSFRPQDGVTGQQLAAVLTRALGYEFEWATVLADAADLGIDVAAVAKLTRGEAFEAMWVTVNTNPKDGELPLGVVLGKLEDTTPKPVALAVTDVMGGNLKSVKVMFSKAVDTATTTNTTITFKVNGSAVVPTSAFDATDKMSYTAELAGLNQSDVVEVTVNGVKTADATEEIKAYVKTITLIDVTAPQVLSLEVVNNKKMVATFSEPVNVTTGALYKTSTFVNTGALVKVDGNLVFVKMTPAPAQNTVTIEFFTALADGAHTVSFADAKDFAGFKIDTKEFAVNTTTDTVAPTAVSVVNSGVGKVIVTFSEEVTNTGTFTVKETGNATNLFVSAALGTDTKTIELTINPFSAAATLGYTVTYKNVEDVFGNKTTTDATISGAITDDVTAPTVLNYSVLANNKIEVVFSEKVDLTAATFKLYASGKTADADILATYTVAQTAAAASGKANAYDLTLAYFTGKDSAAYDVKVEGVKDDTVRKNPMATTVMNVVAKDVKAPTISSAYRLGVPGTSHKIEINFSEAMDATKLANTLNYFVGTGANADKALSTIVGATVTVAADNKKVTINIPDADNAAYVVVGAPALTDAAGQLVTNAPIAAAYAITVGGYPAFTQADITAQATGLNTIKITATGHLFASVDAAAFVVRNTTPADVDLGIVAAQVSADQTYVTLTTSVPMSADAKVATLNLLVYTNGATILDTNNKPLTIATGNAVAIADKIKATQTTTTVGAGANADKLTIAFNEPVTYAAGWSALNLASAIQVKIGTDVLIPGTDYTAAVSGGNVVVTITKNGVVAADVKTLITFPAALTDVNANAVNVLAEATTAAVTEKVAPTAVSQTEDSATQVTIVFDEKLAPATVVLAAFTGTATPSAVALQADGKTVIVTVGTMSGVETIIVANTVTDLAGNAFAGDTYTRGTDF